jgi:uncharacterized membrane protein
MAFEEIKDNLDQIHDETQAFIDTSVSYYKLLGFKVAMKSLTLIIRYFLLILFFLIFVIFVSISGAILIGGKLDSYPLGFLIVSGVYLLLFIMLYFMKSNFIHSSVLKNFSEIFFND